MSPDIFIRVKIRPHSRSVTIIYPDKHGVNKGHPECETQGNSPSCGLRRGGWRCWCSAGSARSVTFSPHGRSVGLHICLWWYWSCWGILPSATLPEVAPCWDLDSSRCEGVKLMFVGLKKQPYPFLLDWVIKVKLSVYNSHMYVVVYSLIVVCFHDINIKADNRNIYGVCVKWNCF